MSALRPLPGGSIMRRASASQMHILRRFSTIGPRATGSLAVVFGGFGFTPRQLKRHEDIYSDHGFDVMPVLSTIPQLVTPSIAAQRGRELARALQEKDAPTVIHTVSGSFWTALFMLAELDPSWREENVRAIMFDSCPPKSDIYAFGGWLSWLLRAKMGIPPHLSRPVVSHLFHPVLPYFGINSTWRSQNDVFMFGDADTGERIRNLPAREGRTLMECKEHAEEAVRAAAANGMDAELAVVPRGAHCLFVRGRHDPVLEPQYIDAYYSFLKARTTASVEWHLFERSQHAMAVVELPEQYKAEHVERLLQRVPEWSAVK